LYFTLRRKGITPRSTIDMLIALTAIEFNLLLLHDDRDFDVMAEHIPELNILNILE
jgi:predicted nucleic acid-binding protein